MRQPQSNDMLDRAGRFSLGNILKLRCRLVAVTTAPRCHALQCSAWLEEVKKNICCIFTTIKELASSDCHAMLVSKRGNATLPGNDAKPAGVCQSPRPLPQTCSAGAARNSARNYQTPSIPSGSSLIARMFKFAAPPEPVCTAYLPVGPREKTYYRGGSRYALQAGSCAVFLTGDC